MNEHTDPFERELAALRPAEPSPQLAERIAQRLTTEAAEPAVHRSSSAAPPLRARRWLAVAVAVAAVAAGGVAVLWPRGEQNAPAEVKLQPVEPLVATAFDDTLPSLASYRRALARSPEEFDRLLSRHRAQAESTHSSDQVRGFERFESQLHPILGGL